MTSAVRSIRLLPGGDSLDRQRYKFGEIFYDRENNTIRIYDGETVGGFRLATEAFVEETASSSFIGTTAPVQASPGNIWFNSENGRLYIYYNNSWIEPASSGGSGGGITLEEARDATASMLLNGSHTGISFSHDDSSNQISATVSFPTITFAGLSDKPTALSAFSNDTGFITSASLAGLATETYVQNSLTWNNVAGKPTFATVATSGSYDDLSNKPNIPSAYTLPTATGSVLGGIKIGTGLSIDGNGVVSVTVSGGGDPGGSNTHVQFNNNGVFGGSANFTFDGTNVVVAGSITASTLTSSGVGTPTYTSASDFIFNTGNNLGALVVNGDVELTGTITTGTYGTSLNGILKGNGTSITTAVSGTDFQAPLTLTTTGTSGAATLVGSTLNIPQYTVISNVSQLTDMTAAGLTVNEIYLPAITRLDVTNSGATAYLFDQYSGNNPTIYAISGTTIAFNLLNVTGHPFLIQNNTGGGFTNYSTGLVHVDTNGTVSTGASALAKTSGTLYWKIPGSVTGTFRYICQAHAGMVGTITVKDIAAL